MYHYLINTPSEFPEELLKAYKSLDAYTFFYQWTCGRYLLTFGGWKQGVLVHKDKGK